ncbi:MAG: UDP-N-acetylmuramoyl-L-alanine--D-glutamate ligase [Serpentinimonas sp.]|nr:UDP-N-acetylmuramoyl-L-alanine--D-glutamate ligase [Serpentinimonas sp.]
MNTQTTTVTATGTPASAMPPGGLAAPCLVGEGAPWLQRALAPAAQALHGRAVLVLGLGASGLALARWCTLAGARVTVADTRASAPQAAVLAAEAPHTTVRLQTRFDADLFAAANWALVCRSPGILPSDMAGLAAAAQEAGVPIVGELGLFGQALEALGGAAGASAEAAGAGLGRGEESERVTDEPRPSPALAADPAPAPTYRPYVLAITGTNGKTTTTALTAHLLRAAGWSVALAGNIGPTLLDELRQRLHSGDLPQAWVLELSSFQLDAVQGFEASAATVLNLSEDHLDWHGSMAAYGAAKARIYGQRALMLLNRDDPTVMSWCPQPPVAVKPTKGRRAQPAAVRPYLTFGTDAPQRPGDWGLQTINGLTWLVRAQAPNAQLQALMPAEALRIRGRHNASNALAALALASAVGAPLAALLHGLRDYRGEPHRVEPVGIVAEVEYIDDSKGTNVGATLAALHGLGVERRLVLILGGDGKGQDFKPLVPAVARYARAVALIGRDAAAIEAVLSASAVPLQRCATLPEAVRWCAAQARLGDAVLLSPACASLDMFRDYAHRAEVFVAAVRELQQEGGTPT